MDIGQGDGMKEFLNDKADTRVQMEQESWIEEEISKVYWAFADDLSDESSERLRLYLDGPFKDNLEKILWEDYQAYGK